MDADKTPLPPYARRGVLLDRDRELWAMIEVLREPVGVRYRTERQLWREDFLQPLLRLVRRIIPRKRR